MPTKRNETMPRTPRVVKNAGRASLAFLMLATTAIAPSAFAGEPQIVDRVVTVKFKTSDLRSPDGVEAVHDKIVKTARRSCKADRKSLNYLGQTLDECTDDLVKQFVANADHPPLTRFHSMTCSAEKPVQFSQLSQAIDTP